MKKNIILAILVITSILSIIYGQYQKAEALKYKAAAIENEKRAKEMAMLAEKHMREVAHAHDMMAQAEAALAAGKKPK